MGPRWVMGIVLVGVAVMAAVVVAVVAQGGGEPSSTADYQAVVVNTRDRVDFALGRLSTAKSLNELLERMDEAAVAIDGAADNLNDVKAPDGLETYHERLVRELRRLSTDVQGTADQARVPGFENLLLGAKGLSFDSWDAINTILEALRTEGVDVQPLSRHATT